MSPCNYEPKFRDYRELTKLLCRRFHDIAWGKTSSDHGAGILAGALENGSLDLWDAKALMSGER